MTKKDIEERLKQEMQQNIPDKDALWQRIETRLPEQPPVNRRIRMSSGRRILTAAACLLLMITGIRVMNRLSETAPSQENIMMEQDNADEIQFIRFEEYFQEDAILSRTELFIDVRVLDSIQEESGTMRYALEVIDVYGGELNTEEITLRTDSAYVLETDHEYVIPVYYREDKLNLSYECAPQIERTQNHKLIIPNGWYTLMQSDAVPVQYDSYGTDDYFYDRMYLTPDWSLELLIQKFENL